MSKYVDVQSLYYDLEYREKLGGLSVPYHWIGPLTPAIDFVLVVATSALICAGYHYLVFGTMGDVGMSAGVGALIQLHVTIILAARGSYKVEKLAVFSAQIREVATVWATAFLIFLSMFFVLKVSDALSRGTTLTFSAAGLVVLIGWRRFIARYLTRSLASGRFAERRIIVVSGEDQAATSRILLELRRFGYRPLMVVDLAEVCSLQADMSSSPQDSIQQMITMAQDPQNRIEELFLVLGKERERQIDTILEALRILPIPVRLIPDQFTSELLERPVTQVGRIWTAELQPAPLNAAQRAVKQAFDISIAATALFLLAPLMIITAVLIKLDSKGPVLFKQTRNGFNGRPFRILKFRTMTVLEDANVIRQAVRNDRRVTRVGRWLRRTSIDELPQLINVIRGDMSISGPRPHAAAHDIEYGQLIARYAFRHRVKPGLTGWAQVNGLRGETATLDHMIKRVEYDIWYINNWSLALDIRIFLRTLFVILPSRSAY